MVPKNELLTKVFGKRLSKVFTGNRSSYDDRRPSTSPLVGQTSIQMSAGNKRHTIASPQSQASAQPETETKMEAQAQPEQDAAVSGSFDDSSKTHRRAVSSPSAPQRRLSRRTSLRQRFWSMSSSNQFREIDEDNDKDYPSHRGTYIPKHAAASFQKSTNQRKSVHQLASERIASRFSDSDDTTLCSLNCREEIPPEIISRDLDLWLSTLHRQQALQALSTAADVNTGPALSPTYQDKHNRLSQTYHDWAPGAAPVLRNETIVESDHSEDEYGVFADAAAVESEPVARPAVRNSVISVRNSVVSTRNSGLWTDAELSSTAAAAAATVTISQPEVDPMLHRNSTYGGGDLQPRTMAGFQRPASYAGPTATIPSYETLTSLITPRPPASLLRTRSERRTVCAKSPGVMTVIEA